MSDNYSKLVKLILFIPIVLNSMTISVKDSIIYNSASKYINLSNDFIIESTLKITLDGSVIDPILIYPIEGKVYLNTLN